MEDSLSLKEIEELKILETNPVGDVFLSDEFELKLKQFLEIKAKVEQFDKLLKDKMKVEMAKYPEMKKFEGRYIRCGVSRPVYKSFIVDPKEMLTNFETLEQLRDRVYQLVRFAKIGVDSRAVNEYIKATTTKIDGKKHYLLPDNIKEEEPKEDPTLTIKIL